MSWQCIYYSNSGNQGRRLLKVGQHKHWFMAGDIRKGRGKRCTRRMHCFCWKFNLYCPWSRSCDFSYSQFIIPIDWREPRPATLGYLNLHCRIQFQVGGNNIYSGRVSVVDILRQNLDTVVNGTHLACCRRCCSLLHRRHHHHFAHCRAAIDIAWGQWSTL